MTFAKFMNHLHPIIGEGERHVAFTKSMLASITTEKADEFLNDYKNDTYKSYFNENRSICNFATLLAPYIEPADLSLSLFTVGNA